MSQTLLFDLTVPIYLRGLEQLSHMVDVGQQWAIKNTVPEHSLLEARLAQAMEVRVVSRTVS
jgi:hypothetical protein